MKNDTSKDITLSNGKVYYLDKSEEHISCTECSIYHDENKLCGEANAIQDCTVHVYKERIQNEIKEESVSTQKKAHKHAELIKRWADGAQIQIYSPVSNSWADIVWNRPYWGEDDIYRIKPEEKKPVVRWLWTYECAGGWYTCNFFRTEEEMLEYHDKDSIIKLEWTRTEFPK